MAVSPSNLAVPSVSQNHANITKVRMQKEPSWFALLLYLAGYATKALELKTLG